MERLQLRSLGDLHHGQSHPGATHFGRGEENMAVTWQKDIDTALDEAQHQTRHLLLDFSAAPM